MSAKTRKTRLCTDPWSYIEIGTFGSIAPCCKYQPVEKIGPGMNTVEEVLRSPRYVELRRQLLSGELSATCAACHIRPTGTLQELEQVVNAKSKSAAADPKEPSPKELELRIDLTTRCNLRCTYCAVSAPNYVGQDMDADTFSELVKFLKNIPKNLDTKVHINGHGETTYHPEWVKAAQAVIGSGQKPFIITNLAKNYRQDEIDLLAQFACIQISLDSADETLMKKIRKPVRVSKIFENLAAIRKSSADNGTGPPQISLSVGIYDPSIWTLLDLIDEAQRLNIREVVFWNLVEYPHQKYVSALGRLDDEKLRKAHEIMKSLQQRLFLYKIDHSFAGDFFDKYGRDFLLEPGFFDALQTRLVEIDKTDRLWVLENLKSEVCISNLPAESDGLPSWNAILEQKKRLGRAVPVPDSFDENLYFKANPDVKAAVDVGAAASGFDHYISYGRAEGRRRPIGFM